jgi:hypothetical protein
MCSNRFAPLNPQQQTRRTLPPSSSRWLEPRSVSQESSSRNSAANDFASILTINSQSQEGNSTTRNRSNSIKRKNTSEDFFASKSARIDTGECPHLKVINENSKNFAKILENLSDYSGTDEVIATSIRGLTVGINSINDILGSLCAERLIPADKPSPVIISTEPAATTTNAAGKNNPPPRKTLSQAPLGDGGGLWSEVVGRQTRKSLQQASKVRDSSGQYAHNTDGEEQEQPASQFSKAIKDAERSILIFNLDMGQSPIMNPSTMSAKVTVALLDKKAEFEEQDKNNHSRESREFVDDILSQVVKMDFFGKKTGPCKIPGKPELNGKFFTIPVKLMFKDRSSAVAASDLLRVCMGINTTTPYHKSLRAAMTQVMNKARECNPGYQAKVNIDLAGKAMKCSVRTDTSPPGNWVQLGNSIPIPKEALDPSSRNYNGMDIPVSPSKLKLVSMNVRNKSKSSDRMSSSSVESASDLGGNGNPPTPQERDDPFLARAGKLMRTPPPPKKNPPVKEKDKSDKNGSGESQY